MLPNAVTLEFDERIYSVEAIQKAAYRYINLFSAGLTLEDGIVKCVLQPSQEFSPEGLEHHLDEFKKELLDQQLRIKIKTETEAVRNLILGVAFSRAGLPSSE